MKSKFLSLIINKIIKRPKYLSCNNIRAGFNFYRSNKISACCYTTEDKLIISNIEDYTNLEDIVKDIEDFQNKLIEKHKKGNHPQCCKECTNLKLAYWSDKVDKKFSWIPLNHYKICNLKCVHCGYRNSDDKEKDSNHELVLKVIDVLSKKNKLDKDVTIAIGGGEPSINKGIDKIIQYCLDKKYHMLINSNGAKYSELIAEGVNRGLIHLDLTPDAGSKDVYTKIKGVDCFDTTWANIKRYIETTEGKANIKFIIEKGNSDDVENMIKMLKSVDAKHVSLSFDLNIKKEDYEKYREPINKFIDLCKKEAINVVVNSFVPQQLIEKREEQV